MPVAEIDDRELRDALSSVAEIAKRLPIDAAMVKVSSTLEDDEKEFFDRRQDPAGRSWASNWEPWAQYKQERVGHELPLLFSGRLQSSMTTLTGDSIRDIQRETSRVVLQFGTSVPYAKKMEDGGPSFFPLFGQTINITSRVFAGFKETRPDKIANSIADAIIERMKE
jgi:phage gpG-like protein